MCHTTDTLGPLKNGTELRLMEVLYLSDSSFQRGVLV